MKKNVYKNIILFVVGYCLYTTIEVLFRGYSYPASGLMGGLSIVIIDKINDETTWDVDLSIQAFAGALVITVIELIVGKIAKYTTLLPVMWDYTDLPMNVDGIICLPFFLAWVGLSVVAIFLADAINYYVLEDGERPHYRLFGKFVFWFKRKRCDEKLWFD